jgi:hypothetical protein
MLVTSGHGSSFDLSVPFLLKKHVGLQHCLLLDLTQFSPVLWLERVPEMQLLHLGLGGHEGFFSSFIQTGLE